MASPATKTPLRLSISVTYSSPSISSSLACSLEIVGAARVISTTSEFLPRERESPSLRSIEMSSGTQSLINGSDPFCSLGTRSHFASAFTSRAPARRALEADARRTRTNGLQKRSSTEAGLSAGRKLESPDGAGRVALTRSDCLLPVRQACTAGGKFVLKGVVMMSIPGNNSRRSK